MRIQNLLAALAATLTLTPSSFAEVLINPSVISSGEGSFTATFASSEVEYDVDDAGTSEVERKIFGGEAAFSIAKDTDVVFQAGVTRDVEYENLKEDGDGYLFGGGLRAVLMRQKQLTVTGYGLLTFFREEVELSDGDRDIDVETDLTELHGGVVGALALSKKVSVYGGAEIVPYSDGEIKADGQDNVDFERDDLLNLRVGTNYRYDQVLLRGELAFLGEETLTFSGTYQF